MHTSDRTCVKLEVLSWAPQNSQKLFSAISVYVRTWEPGSRLSPDTVHQTSQLSELWEISVWGISHPAHAVIAACTEEDKGGLRVFCIDCPGLSRTVDSFPQGPVTLHHVVPFPSPAYTLPFPALSPLFPFAKCLCVLRWSTSVESSTVSLRGTLVAVPYILSSFVSSFSICSLLVPWEAHALGGKQASSKLTRMGLPRVPSIPWEKCYNHSPWVGSLKMIEHTP